MYTSVLMRRIVRVVRRTQIYLDESMDRELRQRAASEGRSAAALIREAVTAYLARPDPPDGDDPIRAMAGAFAGMGRDASVEHDRDLYGSKPRRRRR